MRVNKTKQAFTLIELLVVITIIGIVSTAALVVLKDTGEVKALQYTKKVMKTMKDGIAEKEEDGSFTGFVNDMGTLPHNAHFLINVPHDAHFMGGNNRLEQYRIINLYKYHASDYDGDVIPMPFMDTPITAEDFNDSNINGSINASALFTGYQGGYIGECVDGADENRSIKDGWSKEIVLSIDTNTSMHDTKPFLILKSGGSDQAISGSGEEEYLKPEFDEFHNSDSIKALYADDYNQSYQDRDFVVTGIEIEMGDLNTTEKTIDIIIYSPMLYYVEDSSSYSQCEEHNTTHAYCDSAYYKTYMPYLEHNSSLDLTNYSWHVGVIKYDMRFENLDGSLHINNDRHNFSGFDGNLSKTSFFNSATFEDGPIPNGSGDDDAYPFYMMAGEKKIVIVKDGSSIKSYSCLFFPGRKVILKENECELR